MGLVKNYEELDVFNKAYDLSITIHKTTLNFPDYEKFALASQMRRASKGICANIVEGFAKHTHSSAEFKRFVKIALGSSEEMRLWLKYARDLGYISNDEYQRLNNEYLSVTKMLQGVIRNWKE